MKKKRPILLRIIAATLALAIFVLILQIPFAVYGNPIYFQRSWYEAKAYIAEKYPDSDYVIESVGHSWNGGGYIIKVKSPTKRDEHFYMYMHSNGTYHFSDDNRAIGRKEHMKSRLSSTYSKIWREIAQADATYSYSDRAGLVFDHYDLGMYLDGYEYQKHENSGILNELPLNVSEYQPSYGEIGGRIGISINQDVYCMETLIDALLKTKALAEKNNFPFHAISVDVKESNGGVHPYTQLAYFLKEDIYEVGLEERIRLAQSELQAYYDSYLIFGGAEDALIELV